MRNVKVIYAGMIMSGAAGLAAAKRRRSAAPPPPRSSRTPLQSSTVSPPPTPVVTQQQAQSDNKMTPLQSLNQHDTRIKELEEKTKNTEALMKEVDELKQTILKMQTFAIETSLDVTKIKKNIKLEE